MSADRPSSAELHTHFNDPGRTLAIAGLILAVFLNVIGLVVSIVARRKSKNAGFENGLATAGIIVGSITTMGAIISIVAIIGFAGATAQVYQQCKGHPNQPVIVKGQSVSCPAGS